MVGTLVFTQKAHIQKVEKVRYGKTLPPPHPLPCLHYPYPIPGTAQIEPVRLQRDAHDDTPLCTLTARRQHSLTHRHSVVSGALLLNSSTQPPSLGSILFLRVYHASSNVHTLARAQMKDDSQGKFTQPLSAMSDTEREYGSGYMQWTAEDEAGKPSSF